MKEWGTRKTSFGNKVCPVCGNEFEPSAANQKYCSIKCGRERLKHERMDYIKGRSKERLRIPPELLKAYNCECAICHWSIPEWMPQYSHKETMHGLNYHHIIPSAEGGSSSLDNVIVLCPNCHKAAHAGILTPEYLKQFTYTEKQVEELAMKYDYKIMLEREKAIDEAMNRPR